MRAASSSSSPLDLELNKMLPSSTNDDLMTNVKTDDDHRLLIVPTLLEQQMQDDDTDGIISADDEANKDTAPLIVGLVADPPSGSIPCANVPSRYVIAIWAFFGFFCLYAVRVNLSVAIVAMVAPQSDRNQSVRSCPVAYKNSTGPPTKYEFDWSPKMEGFVLGGFFYGYIVAQIIGGNLAEKFGAKWIFGGTILISGILTLLTPIAARIDVRLLIAIRVLTGIVCGPGFPSAGALWGKWIPPSERSTVPPASQTGSNFGVIFTTPLVSVMIESGFLGGWPSAFYVFGTISCLWFVGWCYFGFNSPVQHPRITPEERLYITKQLAVSTRKHRKTPWNHILRCPPLYGLAILHICSNYVFYTLLTSLPIYFSTILNFNLHENGFIFALPYGMQFLFTIITGQIVDRIRRRNIVSITTLRKVQTIIGSVGTCIFLVSIGFMGCNHVGAVICCIFAVGFIGMHTSGALISHLDIASNYAGTLVGITNSLATIPGFVGPYVVGAITNNNQTLSAWKIIFNISAGIGAFGCIAYCILFNGEEQPWNRIRTESERCESVSAVNT